MSNVLFQLEQRIAEREGGAYGETEIATARMRGIPSCHRAIAPFSLATKRELPYHYRVIENE
jgi:hypothetical protein